MTKIMNFIKKFLKNRVREFLDIYVDEEKIRESYGNEYADRFSNINPATGKKTISGLKVITRVFIVFMLILCAIVAVRMLIYF